MNYEEYIQWAKNSIKELSKLIGIPKTFLKEKNGGRAMTNEEDEK